MDVQHLFISGRATRDVELLESKQGKKFAKVGVACNRYMGKESDDEVTFYECLFFGPKVEGVEGKISKGDTVLIHGRPEADAYISKKEGEPKATLTVFVENWKVLK